MKIKFWGTRGTIPTPGAKTLKYGGRTLCTQVTSDSGTTILLDGGTGIRNAGLSMLGKMPVHCSVFISHTHWDHIQGIPFFVPMFIPGNQIDFYGSFDPVNSRSFKEIIQVLMTFEYFPVRFDELKGSIRYFDLQVNQTVTIGDISVTSFHMNHPILAFGYKVEADGKSLFYTGDHEPFYNIYKPGDAEFNDYQEMLGYQEREFIDFIRGVDALIIDSTYTNNEYPNRIGWGHGTWERSLELGVEAGVGRLFFFHHDPDHTDEQIDRFYEEILSRQAELGLTKPLLSVAIEDEEHQV